MSWNWQEAILAVMGGVFSLVIVPSVAWLIREVLSVRRDLTGLSARYEARSDAIAETIDEFRDNCHRHQQWGENLQGTLNRLDRNIVRLCQKADVNYEGD